MHNKLKGFISKENMICILILRCLIIISNRIANKYIFILCSHFSYGNKTLILVVICFYRYIIFSKSFLTKQISFTTFVSFDFSHLECRIGVSIKTHKSLHEFHAPRHWHNICQSEPRIMAPVNALKMIHGQFCLKL